MSYATGTTHYNLPLTVGTDKRDWADTNQAFSNLDTAVYSAVSDVATAGTAIEGLETRMTTAEGNISDNAADITSLDTRMTTAEGAISTQAGQISDVRNDLEDMICAYNEPTATSTHAYGTGENDNHYFIYNDVLYRATQSIAIGDTIVPNTNCTTTNLTTEIAAIEDLSDDVQQLQTNVSDLQSKVAKSINATEILNTTLPNATFANCFTAVATTINANRDYDEYVVIINDCIYRMSEKTSTEIRLSCPFMSGNGDNIVRHMSFNTLNNGIFSQYAWTSAGVMSYVDLLTEPTTSDKKVVITGVNNSNS